MSKKRFPGGSSSTSEGNTQREIPDPEVPEKPARRKFTAEYKLRILRETDLAGPGEIGAILRREGLYSSLLSSWRQQRDKGMLQGLTPKKRGRKAKPTNPLARRVEELERENRKLQKRLEQADTIIEFQKKVSEVLGIPYTADLRYAKRSFILHTNLGVVLFRQGRPDEAAAAFDAALEIAPNYGTALSNRGVISMRRGNLPKAERYFRRAITTSGYALAYGNLALVLMATGRPEEAEKILRAGLARYPHDETLRGHFDTLRTRFTNKVR